MGVKVVVREGDVREALRRFRKAIAREKPRYHRRRVEYYLKPSEKRRRKEGNSRLVARREEGRRRRTLGIDR